MKYNQMAKRLTLPEMRKAFLQKVLDLPQEGQLWDIKQTFQDILKGIGKDKYHQVRLLIDNNVKPIIQPQSKISFVKREKLDKILDQLDKSEQIEQVESLTDQLSNLVSLPKPDSTQIRMNIMTNIAMQRTQNVIPTMEELRYELNGTHSSPNQKQNIDTCKWNLIKPQDQSPPSTRRVDYGNHEGFYNFQNQFRSRNIP